MHSNEDAKSGMLYFINKIRNDHSACREINKRKMGGDSINFHVLTLLEGLLTLSTDSVRFLFTSLWFPSSLI